MALTGFWFIQEYSNGFFAAIFLALFSFISSSNIMYSFYRENINMWLSLLGRVIFTGLLLGFSSALNGIIPIISLTLMTLMFTLSEIQQELVPSSFPILHNPLKLYFRKKTLIVNHLIRVLGYLNWICIYSTPIFISAWITCTYIPSVSILSRVFRGLFLIRALKFTWMDIRKTSIDIYVLCVINSYFNGNFESVVDYRIINAHLLFFVSFFGGVTLRFLSKFWFWLLALVHFITSRKQVLSFWYVYLIPSVLISPISIVLAAFLNAPVMPLFGLPIFWMGFLRPQKMWPDVGIIIV